MKLLDILFPKRCVGCGKLGNYFCKECVSNVHFTRNQICPACEKPAIEGVTHPRCRTIYTIDGLTNFFHYDGPVRKAVKLLKYKFVTDLSEAFIELIPHSFFQSIVRNIHPTILIPIPLHSSRLRFRGFNHSEVLGSIIAGKLNISMKTDILKRTKKTKPQVEMKDRKKRLANMEKAFSVSSNILISQYPNILLFDDVFTTGATLRCAANVLKRTGAKKVWGMVMAHG